MGRNLGRGLTLSETVIALFLMASATLIVIGLFHYGLRSAGRAKDVSIAVRLAENKLVEIQEWATDADNFYSNWATYDGVTTVDSDFPGYNIFVDCDPGNYTIFTPCTDLEAAYAPNQRRMTESVVPVEISVSWGDRSPSKTHTLVTRIGSPYQPVGVLEIQRVGGDPDPVPPEGEVLFEAVLKDTSGRAIPDVTFNWAQKPGSSRGQFSITGGRNRNTSRLVNRYGTDDTSGLPYSQLGNTKVRAYYRYHGVPDYEDSASISLDGIPPPP